MRTLLPLVASTSDSRGRMKVVSERFISRASACICLSVKPRASVKMANGLPASGVQLDVFTRTPLAGNPLAIFTDARGLTDKQMQALAREMNLSETTFILPREPEIEATNGKRVRIFTTREELPFAGHPTLGTALYLYSTTDTAPDEIVLDLNVGKIPVRFTAIRPVPGTTAPRAMFLARCVSAILSLERSSR